MNTGSCISRSSASVFIPSHLPLSILANTTYSGSAQVCTAMHRAPGDPLFTDGAHQASVVVMDGVTERLTVREAAARLGVTTDAIRQRIKRGTIPHEKGEDGLTYVYLTPSGDVTDTVTEAPSEAVTEALLSAYEDQITFLRRELERKDTIIMSLVQRVPELEPSETPVSSSDFPADNTPPEQEHRSWWRRIFAL